MVQGFPVADHHRFIECLNNYRDYDFGLTHITDIELVYNDWYMSNQLVSRIKTFSL
ncbi:hypothetical protein [Desulfosporosinus acidiphilus]|uniref:hypothetical protein n=1 Tax=Desulfosporosinus acidiphilus TaxID=885581 RepID=UPI00030E244E|nr:hypothetical protein [Desulfosporosinus acidiphilus]